MLEKSVFPETSSPELTSGYHSQSPVFGLAVLYPTGSEISRFWYVKNTGKENRYRIVIFLLYLSVTPGSRQLLKGKIVTCQTTLCGEIACGRCFTNRIKAQRSQKIDTD